MRKMLTILGSSILVTFQDLKQNKLRTGLSLTGVAFGIFCIIGVLATVNSLERNIQNEVKSLGSTSIYIDKWDYTGDSKIPFWKFRARPDIKNEEANTIRTRSELIESVTFLMRGSESISHDNDVLQNATVYGINEDQINIQPIEFAFGRYISPSEFQQSSPVCLVGYDVAENLFGTASRALGKQINFKGRKLWVVGVITKQGSGFIGWDFDNCIMAPYRFVKQVMNEEAASPIIIVKGKAEVNVDLLMMELRGIMRQIRRLSPKEEDNFSLNSVAAMSEAISQSFVTINIVGSIIGGISLVVGMFGIANIMFVTVKERTSIIGLKKAIGAKSRTILFEFLLEAAMLCILGGAIGLIMVYILTLILSGPMKFPIYISLGMLGTTLLICIVVGILAGIIPASRAAKLDPVVAIRS
ncbi:MAG: ABC transporter permease [Ferruginibacter sp.]|nr:ABC transporter permease [Ferruginibacter sp.]